MKSIVFQISCMVAVVAAFQTQTSTRNAFGGIENRISVGVQQTSTTLKASAVGSGKKDNSAPPLKSMPPRKVCLMVEPTPFTHVSGYSNRFKEMLRFLSKAGDKVEIVTTDDTTEKADLPKESFGYPIYHTQGFQFKLYQDISLTFDLPELKGVRVLEKLKPDLIHATSPGFLVMAAVFYARVLRIPCVCSYHTHLPNYAIKYLNFIPGIENLWESDESLVATRCQNSEN